MARGERVVALDALRGLAVAGMILVTSPGDWGATYAQLQHAAWDGWTMTDMVFPAFLFSVGAAVGLSMPLPLGTAAARRALWIRAGRRVAALILLGLALEATRNLAMVLGAPPSGEAGLDHLRLPGILQRIALAYALALALTLTTSRREGPMRHVRWQGVAAAAFGLLALYWLLMTSVPVPGYGTGQLDPEGNLAAFVDRAVFGTAHLWPLGAEVWGGPVVYDPEGLLSTLPATANVLFGVIAGTAWRRPNGRALVAAFGGLAFLAGLLLDPVIVINKRIWTPSFAMLSTGVSAAALSALGLAFARPLVARLCSPLLVLGGNAILAFVLATLLGRVYAFPFLPVGNETLSPQTALFRAVAAGIPDPKVASLVCALTVLALVTLAVLPLHRRGLHLRL